MVYNEHTRYSAIHDCEVTRLSLCDDRGGEFFCLIPRDGRAKKWRAVRDKVLEDLQSEIQAGSQPGQFIPRLDP